MFETTDQLLIEIEVLNPAKKFHKKRTPGPNGIPGEVVIAAAKNHMAEVTAAMNHCLKMDTFQI